MNNNFITILIGIKFNILMAVNWNQKMKRMKRMKRMMMITQRVLKTAQSLITTKGRRRLILKEFLINFPPPLPTLTLTHTLLRIGYVYL